MKYVALASGSNGNAVLVETADARLLFDAGLSGRKLAERAASRGVSLSGLDAILVTHNHTDHVGGAGVIHRRYGAPLLMTRGTWRASRHRLGRIERRRTFCAGEVLTFGRTVVESIPTPHDGTDGVAYVVESRGARLGILTDLGHPFPRLMETLPTLDATLLEANYDRDMLANGPYPEPLKERIAGPGGHLANDECVELAGGAGSRLRTVVLCHLSGENNAPAVVRRAARPLAAAGVEVQVATRTKATRVFTLEA